VTIKLSENQENVLQNDGTYATMIVETHFQMNYSTGEWKRIKKYRRLEEDVIFTKAGR
jgi:negative elongation factor A